MSGSVTPSIMPCAFVFCVPLLCVPLLCVPLTGQMFSTGAPVLPPASREMRLMAPAEYRKFAAWAEGNPKIKVIRQLPPNLSPGYRVGANFVYDLENHSWVLDRDSDGYKLFLDLKGDGDLSRANALRFHDQDGVRLIDVHMGRGEALWTARFELVPDTAVPGAVAVRMNLAASRSGKIVVHGQEIPFRLSGSSGRYDVLGSKVSFDRGRNGNYESYRPTDRWVNLAGRTYEFQVDPHGAFLTLKESDSRSDRPSLKPGSPIPDVSLPDLEGKMHALRRNSADVTLLEFWNTSCSPCREEMPKLKALFDKVPRSRFNIIGVSSDESEEVLKKYLLEFGIPWPECREADDGPMHRLMRIEMMPTYFLLSRQGEILDRWAGSGPTIAKIEAALKAVPERDGPIR